MKKVLIFSMVVVLCAVAAYAFELPGCEGRSVNITSVSDFSLYEEHVKCHVDREPKGTNLVGWFLPNQDIIVVVGAQEMVLRLEEGVLVGVNPQFARPSVRVTCDEAIVQSSIDAGVWPDTFDGVRKIVNSCDVGARRLVVVPQVTGLLVVFEQVQGVVDLLSGPGFTTDGVTSVVMDSLRLLFAASHAVFTFAGQFVGATV